MPVPLPSVSSATRRDAVVLAHAAATLVMVGILWMVQVVHYPLFREVGDAAYPTNCCFGGSDGRTLFTTELAPGRVCVVEGVPAPGLELNPWPAP